MTTVERTEARPGICEAATLLVVEDDPNDVLFIRRGLGKVGMGDHVQVARDGSEAIAYLKGEGCYCDRVLHPLPALVMLDLKLPRTSGLEVLEWLRNDPRFKDLPVVILTSSNEARDIARASELEVMAYHTKPADLKEFTELVKSIGLLFITLAK